MPFDQTTRNRLQRFVLDARSLLDDEFTQQCQQEYGIDPTNGTIADIEVLTHLDSQRIETARILRDIFAHYKSNEPGQSDGISKELILRIIREQAFTLLNRLVAIRMMEARGIVVVSVGRGLQSDGFQLYSQVAGRGLGETGDAYAHYLKSIFDEFTEELPGLFDRSSPQGRLFPRETALNRLLALINDPEIEQLWAEDEAIGWIYQYFNSAEERKAMRDASQAPRNSRELAVRNQFFTPRYVVEFLTDNTLGRLWFNWTGGHTNLRDSCQYLLIKPDESPASATKLRDPRSIKLLDPACGSMHFGLYAFDLFFEIYREAWDWEETHGPGSLFAEEAGDSDLKPLSQTYETQNAFLRDVPRLIVERNIYGVDIDARAAQIASLALWLRAQRAWNDMGVKAADRPQVHRGNVVAAIAPPAEIDLRQNLMAQLDTLDAELFEQTLFMLKGLPEMGVLLRIEKDLPAMIKKLYAEHGDLFQEEDEERWQSAELRLQEALQEFTMGAETSYQGRLFSYDAMEGLRLIDLASEKFDVVVMNPPFGALSAGVKTDLGKAYPNSKNDLLAIFVERGLEMLHPGGRIGAITSRTCFFLSSFQKWREHVVLGNGTPEVMADLGHGVMDAAMVEAAAYVLEKQG